MQTLLFSLSILSRKSSTFEDFNLGYSPEALSERIERTLSIVVFYVIFD